MTPPTIVRRRLLLAAAGTTVIGSAAVGAPRPKPKDEREEEVGPGEDLMREHGVLRRVLLIYREAARRLAGSSDLETISGAVGGAARLVRQFVEDYHERQEEDFIFPRFEKAKKLTDLVAVLRAQHAAGRRLTERIQGLASTKALADLQQRGQLVAALDAFVRMYEPHAAHEDTVLFPALHDIVGHAAYDALGEELERREHKVFGGDGFGQAVADVAGLEKRLGIGDLAAFTPT